MKEFEELNDIVMNMFYDEKGNRALDFLKIVQKSLEVIEKRNEYVQDSIEHCTDTLSRCRGMIIHHPETGDCICSECFKKWTKVTDWVEVK